MRFNSEDENREWKYPKNEDLMEEAGVLERAKHLLQRKSL